MPNIPSPRQGESFDRDTGEPARYRSPCQFCGKHGTPVWVDVCPTPTCHAQLPPEYGRTALESFYERSFESLQRRNVDKQRRRLLAEKHEAASDLLYEHAGWLKRQIATQSNQEDALTYEAKFKAAAVRASKLRTIAARLRNKS